MRTWRHYRIGAWLPLLAWLVLLATVLYAIALNGGFTVGHALVLAFALIMVLAGIQNVRFESGIEDFLYPPELRNPDRRAVMAKARAFLPAEPPPGWSRPMVRRTWFAWEVYAADVVLFAWVVEQDLGPKLFVALANRRSAAAVADERASEILSHLRGVSHFEEVENNPAPIRARYPGARVWTAMPAETFAALPKPPRFPALGDEAMDPVLAAARRYFPAKLPEDWSVPIGIFDPDDTDKRLWTIEVVDHVALVALVSTCGRIVLAVTVFRPDLTPVNSACVQDVLNQFRGISAFVQTDIDEIPNAVAYLGEIESTPQQVTLN